MRELYIGLMSGTSLDGIDAILVDFSAEQPAILANHYHPFEASLRNTIYSLLTPGQNEVNRMCELDVLLGRLFARCALELIAKTTVKREEIRAIGSHGQTIRHHPDKHFTLQVGDPNIIAAKTRITTIADFRRKDIALGGQGAPLVPAFHHALFKNNSIDRAIVNIGGIANVTLLPKEGPILGFDTGPGNTLLDQWANLHLDTPHDENGNWAKRGTLQKPLLNTLLSDPFFKLPPPKSTGREYFHLEWLNQFIPPKTDPMDIETTLVELTAQSITDAIHLHFPSGEVLVCGGGTHNAFLMSRLKALLSNFNVDTTEKYGVHPDWVEAMAFAWLAKQTIEKKTGNITEVTGAKEPSILGGVYYAT